MDQRVVYNLQEAGPEQINNIQGHLNNIRQQRMVLERNLVRNRQRAVGRPGANGHQDQAIAGAGNNHVVPWRQGDQPEAAGNDHNEWRRMNLAMRRWRDLIDPLNPDQDQDQVRRALMGPAGPPGGGGGGGLPNPIENWARRFGIHPGAAGGGEGGNPGPPPGQPPLIREQRGNVPPPNVDWPALARNLRAGGGARLRIPAQVPARAPILGRPPSAVPAIQDKPHALQNMILDGDMLLPTNRGSIGQFISGRPVTPESSYFEVELLQITYGSAEAIVNIGFTTALGAGAGAKPKGGSSAVRHLGLDGSLSLGFNATQGSLAIAFKGLPRFLNGLTKCREGDRVGIRLKFHKTSESHDDSWRVHLTVNDTKVNIPGGGEIVVPHKTELYPSVTVQPAKGDELCALAIKVLPGDPGVGSSILGGGDMMAVDTAEDEWLRLHDVRLSDGHILEYVGRGKCLVDVGLAQAKTAISTRNHYFEIEIVNPGYSCYIAIGLARKNYPKNRHPGWNPGSIAYHADDGKVFVGSGTGYPFGPRCDKGDIMGCGVLFPRNYECKSDSEEELEQQGGGGGATIRGMSGGGRPPDVEVPLYGRPPPGDVGDSSDGGEDGAELWHNQDKDYQNGVVVGIYFTRNGEVIGRKEIRIPKGGLYPTIGMMSCEEKVRVDLRPLSG